MSAGRSFGEAGAHPLSTSDIYAYTLLDGIETVDERLRFLDVMRTLDAAYLTHVAKKTAVPPPK